MIRKLSHAQQKQSVVLGALEQSNLFGPSNKVLYLKKVGHQKWCLFFDFVCFSGCHFTKSGLFQKQIGNRGVFFWLYACILWY